MTRLMYPSKHFVRDVRREIDKGNNFIVEIHNTKVIHRVLRSRFLSEEKGAGANKMNIKDVIRYFFTWMVLFKLYFIDIICDVLEYKKEFKELDGILAIFYERKRGRI